MFLNYIVLQRLKAGIVLIWIGILLVPFELAAQISQNESSFRWHYDTPENQGFSSDELMKMTEMLAAKGTKKFLVIRNDKVIHKWFADGWEDSLRAHYTASLAKALVGGMSLMAAIDDGYLTPDEAACHYIPQWKKDGRKSMITIRQLATHTSGIEDAEATSKELENMSPNANAHFDIPGWKGQFWKQNPDPFTVARDSAPVIFIPGDKYAYSNPGIGMLTYAVTSAISKSGYKSVRNYLNERIFRSLGINEKDASIGYGKSFNVENLSVVPSWGGGSFTADAIARIGLLILHKGNWQGTQLIDTAVVNMTTSYAGTALPVNPVNFPSDNFRNEKNPVPATTAGWYSNFDGTWPYVPRDAIAGGGAGNQHLFVIPSLNLVIVRMGDKLYDEQKDERFWLGAEKYILNPLMNAIKESPYPESSLSVEFDPPESIVRMAEGGDNWPSTWGKDDMLYTAYGDGYGFNPNTEIKLSLGLSTVSGTPPDIKGINLRTRSGERTGQGKYGVKASGLLMVEDVLYMMVRNSAHSQLMWSEDNGITWEQSDWKFEKGFGCPTILNYGKNYAGAPDEYVYLYSQDEESAYKNSDRFVLTRVPVKGIKDWKNYTFFAGMDSQGQPLWTGDIRKRQGVFINPGKCYRSGVTYHPVLKKYLWCQTIQMAPVVETDSLPHGADVRYKGGLGIFESDYPWGPWRTVFYTRDWDTGPGETSSIPVKWMSKDGKSAWLLFSGDDCFSIRRFGFVVNSDNQSDNQQ